MKHSNGVCLIWCHEQLDCLFLLWHDDTWNGEEQVSVTASNSQVSTRKLPHLVLYSSDVLQNKYTICYAFLNLLKLGTSWKNWNLNKILYVDIEQPWNAFKYSATSVPVDALNQGLQMHDLPSTDDHFFDLRASEVGIYIVHYQDSLYSFEN